MKTGIISLTLLAIASLFFTGALAQVGIGTTTPDASSMLDVSSTSKGMLVPRMTSAQRSAISSPVTGLLVYQTDSPSGYYYYDGVAWKLLENRTEGMGGGMIDMDGNKYATVIIGTQEWMAENLHVRHYRNGDTIPEVTVNATWGGLTTGAFCWYSNNQATNGKYGAIYNWFAVSDSRYICPNGWHAPTDAEWTKLTTYLGGLTVAGGPMKASGQWNSPNTGATNSSGFSVLPGGYRDVGGSYSELGSKAYFWTASVSGSNAWYRSLDYNSTIVVRTTGSKVMGAYIRCVKD
jgi:uncharacterized protein (TIGR02145 family)